MYSLILDTATKRLYASIIRDDKILFEKYIDGKNDHAKYVVKIIEEGLNLNKLKIDDIDNLIVGIGPGSYTGERMGVTVMKMFSSFKNIKLYEISTLKLMSSSYEGVVLSHIDARHGNVFASIYDTKKSKYYVDEGIYLLDDLKKMDYEIEFDEDSFRVNPFYVIKNKIEVENPDLLTPNYLRDTEAERNLSAKKI